MSPLKQRLGPPLALIGVGIISAGALVAVVPYRGRDGLPYSPLNHAVSELGQRGVSELAVVFNAAMIVGGLLIALSMLGLAISPATTGARVTGILGTLAGISVCCVGLFPMDDVQAHRMAAIAAFLTLTLVTAWFAAWTLVGHAPYSGWLANWAIAIVAAMLAFLLLPQILQPASTFDVQFVSEPPLRPDVWLATLLEWVVVASGLAFVALLDRARWVDRPGRQSATSGASSASKS